MFDIGFSEMLVVGVVALIVVGPKDLPRMFRTLGEFTGRARRMAREFQSAMNQAADESGVGDIAKDLKKVSNPKKFGIEKIREATDDLTAWTPDEHTGPNTKALAEKRAASKAAAKEKIAANAARMAEERAAREAADVAEASEEPELVPDPAAPKPEAK
ncbi:Sec-independent protein translocase protein TatB [Jannaschia seohaensis]|uniref:Sec-independent protein translocase protein TatB n=1 Tax=Jannaschia seohaensis TaxID=475081 RepID=A0A2Y9B290_9RHOB|nr:Sec-independent protein translocase protein TatB [Jannaschia seohaensis]PWJ13318.1 sec-independent protein translocase protein TatB [Jannaschia seohaensis]SSA50644.1 sec-independent protein translocase protein TatB [Jannaschia seohaensis]